MNVLAFVLLLSSQDDLTVLKPEEQPRKMLYAHLQAECGKRFDARRRDIAALKTAEDVRKRQEELRSKFVEALGGFPEKTPLNPRVAGKISRDGYRIEKVIYESRPDHFVTAVFYFPEGQGPFPGVLVPCGHSENGKAAEPYQRACILMAKNGLAVLCYDPIGQGERLQLLDEAGRAAIKGSTTEHTMVGIGALLVGLSCATYRIWDGIRSLDYLAGRPEVDPKRLGCTGNSGGGTLTAYLMALDDRISCAAPSCYMTSLERLFATIGPQDAEQNITGQVAFGLEHADYVTLRAPKPTLLCTGTQDFFDIQGAWTTFREAKQIYGLLGFGERVDLFEFNDKHGFSRPRREAAMRWMRRWLLGLDDAPDEGEFAISKDADLLCTKSGQVLKDLKGRSAFDFNAEREKELAPNRGKLGKDRLLKEVARLIAVETPVRPLAPWALLPTSISREGYRISKSVLETEAGIRLPLLHFTPKESGKQMPLVVYVHEEGKAVPADVGGPIEKQVQAGHTVITIDLRGSGETTPVGSAKPFGAEWKEAFFGILLNQPLLGQRVRDLLSVVALLAEAKEGVHGMGVGTEAPVVLHAAALDPRITQVTVEGGVISWSAVVRTPISENQLANVVPGALKVYDLPDLAATIAPRPLAIRNPVDPAGRPVGQAELEEVYAAARAAYKAAGVERNLVLQGR